MSSRICFICSQEIREASSAGSFVPGSVTVSMKWLVSRKDFKEPYWCHNVCWNLVMHFMRPEWEEVRRRLYGFADYLEAVDVDRIKSRPLDGDQYECLGRFVEAYRDNKL